MSTVTGLLAAEIVIGLGSWYYLAKALLWLDQAFLSGLKNPWIYFCNISLSLGLACTQFLIFNWIALQLVGGLSFAILLVFVNCVLGALIGAIFASRNFCRFRTPTEEAHLA